MQHQSTVYVSPVQMVGGFTTRSLAPRDMAHEPREECNRYPKQELWLLNFAP